MKLINKKTKKVISVTLVLIFSMSSILMLFPLNPTISENLNELDGEEKSTEMKSPSLSIVGEDEWWNSTFYYRRLINITNPYGEAFTNFIANITFNYTDIVSDGRMNESLKDVRIVENGALRDYFIEKDYPEKDLATVWFETDISLGPDHKELDTYMYYGNENASFASSYLMDKNPDGLMWYKFEEINDEKIIDYMGNYNATVKGNPQIVGGGQQIIGDGCFELDQNDGTRDYLAIENKYYQGHNQIPELTICVWYRTSETTGGWTDNWAFFDFDRSEYFNFFIRPDNGRLGFSSAAAPAYNSYNDQVTTTQNLNDGSWHFGCAKYDGTDKYLYIDNGQQDDVEYNPHSGNAIGVGDDVDFGGGESNDDPRYGFIGDGSEATSEDGSRNNRYYHGFLDEIRYFEESLSPERIYWIAKNYKLNISLNEIQNKEATVEIIVKDVDGRVVPSASVFIFNSTDNVNYTQITNEQGYTEFGSIENLLYDIRVNYTISNGSYTYEEVVYDSSLLPKIYDFTGLFYTVYIEVNLWSIDFEIEDWEYEPMGYGYVLVYNNSGYTELIANLTLNKEFGTQTFRGINTSQDAKYYYEVYYDNADYNQTQTIVNRSVVERTEYLIINFEILTTIKVNETDRDERADYFLVQERFYASGSNETHIGNIKIINTTIIMSKMDDHLDRIDIYTIDSYNNVSTDPIYSYEYTSETQDTIKLNITEFADTFGLFMHIEGTNSTLNCNGIIDVNYTESCNKFIRVNMSKLVINVFDGAGEWNPTYGNVYVEITNGTSGADITTLLTTDEGSAKGQINSDLDFWYINHNGTSSQIYNFTLFYSGAHRAFNVSSDPSNYDPIGFIMRYNYTLYGNGTIEFWMQTSMENYKSEFQEKTWDTSREWGSNFFFRVKFVSTENALDVPPTWTAITDPDFVNWEIKDSIGDVTLFSGTMIEEGAGFFNYTFDSTSLIGGDLYLFEITGEETGFQDPDPVQLSFTVSTKATSIGVYNTSNPTQNLGNNATLYYGETIQLTVFYISGVLLEGATVTYEWQFIDIPIVINDTHTGYYSFEIDTSIADVGTYKIDINTAKQNYTSQYFRFDIVIVHRPTALNGDTKLHHITKWIWVQDSYNFTFQYQDILSDPVINLNDVDDAYYQWYKVSANGSIIGAISNKIDLIEGVNEIYILDFGTNLREVGSYAIFITMQKNNYEVRTAFIDLTVKTRVFSATLQPDKFTDNIISVYSGDPFIFNISLHDETINIPLTGATVQLEFQNTSYTFNETGSGGYSFNITDYNKLMATDDFNISTTDIIISKTNFVTHTINITIILNNRILNASLSEEFVGQLLTIVSGDSLSFEIDILDCSTASGLLDATITIRIGGEIYEDVIIVDNGDGTYTITLESYPDAFFTAEALTGEIIIEQENFRTETISFAVKIEMTEIFPGFPMFYFLMIVGSVVAIAGSLATYRIVQQRRIPTFVKKAKTMKKSIKSNKAISDSLLYPSKEEFIVKKLGEKWEAIGLSLEDILGVKEKKMKLSEAKEPKAKKPKKKEAEIKEPEIKEPEAKEEFKGGAD